MIPGLNSVTIQPCAYYGDSGYFSVQGVTSATFTNIQTPAKVILTKSYRDFGSPDSVLVSVKEKAINSNTAHFDELSVGASWDGVRRTYVEVKIIENTDNDGLQPYDEDTDGNGIPDYEDPCHHSGSDDQSSDSNDPQPPTPPDQPPETGIQCIDDLMAEIFEMPFVKALQDALTDVEGEDFSEKISIDVPGGNPIEMDINMTPDTSTAIGEKVDYFRLATRTFSFFFISLILTLAINQQLRQW